jgi:hypothetical protein
VIGRQIKLTRKSDGSRHPVVEFPFTEVRPSMAGETYQAYQRFSAQLRAMSAPQRAVILLNLCADFSVEV